MVATSAELTLRHLIGLSYEAALEPTKWPEFLKQIVQATNARSAFLRHVDWQAADVSFFETVGYDPSWATAYRNHFVRLDPYASTWTRQPQGVLISSESVVKLADRRTTEYHHDYERPQEIQEGLGCILAKNDGYDLQFALQRGFKTVSFQEDVLCMRLLTPLMPHLARAVQIQRRLTMANEQRTGALEALHQLRVGVMLTDQRGHPFFLNRAAEQLVATCPEVNLSREGLRLSRSCDAAQLSRLIADAGRILGGEFSIAHDCLRVALPNGECLQIQVVPLMSEQTRWSATTPPGSLAIFLAKPGQQRLSAQKLMQLYGLTRAEAKLAVKLAEGRSLDEAATEFSISTATARTQLNAVFNKTGTRRQPELVGLLLTSVLASQAHDEQGCK